MKGRGGRGGSFPTKEPRTGKKNAGEEYDVGTTYTHPTVPDWGVFSFSLQEQENYPPKLIFFPKNTQYRR